MTDSIKPGDLVMIVRAKPCCGVASHMGLVATAEQPKSHGAALRCDYCGLLDRDFTDYYKLGKGYAHVSRLKKIDPPALDESVERVRELEHA